MRRTAFRWLAVSALMLSAAIAFAEDRPRYGGTLRVQLRDAVFSLDPKDAADLTGARHRFAFLLFDRLTRIDDQGRVRPQLAVSWSSDAQRKTWRFTLRSGVVFHDGSPLTVAAVISNFANDARWQVRTGNGPQVVVFECANPIYDLPALLAGAKHSIIMRNAEGPQGTGPFRIAAWQPGRQLSLTANPDYFEGRPYLDGVELLMGNSLREQLIDLRLNRDDLVEVDMEQARRLTAASQRVESAAASRLLAILFRGTNLKPAVRELLALAINRETIHAAILKKSGGPAHSVLPQWLTGYALLFADAPDPARIQKLRTDIGKAPTIYLAYDPAEPVNKAIADRIAVNARDVGITVQVFGEKLFAEKNVSGVAPGQTSRADAVLISLPLGSANTSQALAQVAEAVQLEPGDILAAAFPEQLFAAEKTLLESYQLVPVAHLPAAVWTSTRVRNWKISADGRWKLEQVWLDSVQ